jgi:hypothetical protein
MNTRIVAFMDRTAVLTAALLIVASCGQSPTRPEQQGPASEISVGEITPGSGATLVLRECGSAGLCTDQLKTTFDVLVPADIPNAVLVVSLKQGSLPCAGAYMRTALKAGDLTSFSTSSFSMDYDEAGRLRCPTPVETTSLAFQVFFENRPASAYVARELPYRYTLATQ